MPDMKFFSHESVKKYLDAPDYPVVNKCVVSEMHRQVGNLQISEDGIALRGLLIRHLVMPNHVMDSKKIIQFIADEISTDSYVNIMAQYQPYGKAAHDSVINRNIQMDEYREIISFARSCGLYRGF